MLFCEQIIVFNEFGCSVTTADEGTIVEVVEVDSLLLPCLYKSYI